MSSLCQCLWHLTSSSEEINKQLDKDDKVHVREHWQSAQVAVLVSSTALTGHDDELEYTIDSILCIFSGCSRLSESLVGQELKFVILV